MLKQKYDAAKSMGRQLNDSKEKINQLRAMIEQIRIKRSVARIVDQSPEDDPEQEDPEEAKAKSMLDKVFGKGAPIMLHYKLIMIQIVGNCV